ncbi:MAG: TlpA family protein disulfide reductase [Bacteroidetes bacterium]|nr:MAG: TlpA family protein disulfide reductase [Bacteroidota bacterium]
MTESDKNTENESGSKSKSRNRALVEWAVIILVLVLLKQTGYGTVLQSYVQRGMLLSGILVRDAELGGMPISRANYSIPLIDMDGEPVDMAEWKGKTIFINIWATWCAPCLAEMPIIHDLYEHMDGENIVFAMLSSDDSLEIARAFVEKKGYTFPVYLLHAGLPEPYSTNTIPTTYVISPDGDVVMRHTGMFNYNSEEFRNFLAEVSQ